MKIAGKILWALLCAVFALLTALNLLLAAGTFIDGLPVFGTIANMFTVGYAHLWLIFAFAVTLVCFLAARLRKSAFFEGLWIMSAAAFLCGVFIICSAIRAVNVEGGGADFFGSYARTEYDNVSVKTVRYEETLSDNSFADIYYAADGLTGKPVVLYIHGGGWSGGSRGNDSDYMKRFAANGYVAVSAEYLLSNRDGHYALTDEEQLTYAVAWIENNIAEYGADTESFYIIGDSAGGNLALELAYKINGGVYKEAGGTILPKVSAVSVLYPVTDMAACYDNAHPLFTELAKQMVGDYMGAAPSKAPELYASASPVNFVSADSPATFILVGERDTVVSPAQSEALAEKLDAAGVGCKLVSVPYANHLFDMGGTNFAAQAYMNITLDWFDAHR